MVQVPTKTQSKLRKIHHVLMSDQLKPQMTSWKCLHCTYLNTNSASTSCEMCMNDRHTNPNDTDVVMTPVSLKQLWYSYGKAQKSVVYFNCTKPPYHPLASTTFSTSYRHLPVTFEIPTYCGADRLQASGRSTTVTFTFAHKAIMLCKASLFGDYDTFDLMLKSTNRSHAQQLGRRVSPFDQTIWDKMICSITRATMLAKAKQVDLFRECLLATGDAILANVLQFDFVWGVGLPDAHSSVVNFPGSWRGLNVLGWALMEARTALGEMKISSDDTEMDSSSEDLSGCCRPNDGGIKDLSFDYEYGPAAFERLERPQKVGQSGHLCESLPVKSIVEISYPEAKNMKGQRGQVNVADMLSNIYENGLFMFGDSSSTVNKEIIPAIQHIFHEMNALRHDDRKRVSIIQQLVESCLDCQQVQARTIQKIYADLTSQSLTFEQQLKYSLLPQKEAALNILITKYHGGPGGVGKPQRNQTPYCDLDHTMVSSGHQRAHLISGYVVILGEAFGLEGETEAQNDRFLRDALKNIYYSHRENNSSNDCNKLSNQKIKNITADLKENMSVSDWITALIADINNQSNEADRIIDRQCIFEWASKNMAGDFKFKIFYDESRADDYKHMNPNRPTDENIYQPFLSPSVLIQMLEKVKLIQRKT